MGFIREKPLSILLTRLSIFVTLINRQGGSIVKTIAIIEDDQTIGALLEEVRL